MVVLWKRSNCSSNLIREVSEGISIDGALKPEKASVRTTGQIDILAFYSFMSLQTKVFSERCSVRKIETAMIQQI